MFPQQEKKLLRQQGSLDIETRVKKQVSVFVDFTLVTVTREKVVENIENSKNPRTTNRANEDGKNPRFNLI